MTYPPTPDPAVQPVNSGTASLDDGIDLLHLLALFVMHWRSFLLVLALAFLAGASAVYSITPLYEATATILPQGQNQATSVADLFSAHSPSDIFQGLLSSRSLEDEVIQRAGLLARYHTTSAAGARGLLSSRSVFSVGKDSLVTIKVRDSNAEVAMIITEAYLEALQSQREKMLHSQAAQQNRFFEQQLNQESEAVAQAEVDLRTVQEKTGIVQAEAQTNLGLNAIANVRAQISSLQVQLSSLLLGASDENPKVRTLRAQIAQLQAQEHSMESSAGNAAGPAASVRQMPALNLEYARRQRTLRFHEAIFTAISNQFEAAKLVEGVTGMPFVVIDHAVLPEGRAYPPRTLLLQLAFAASLLLAFLAVGLLLLWEKLRDDPAQQQNLAMIRNSFWRKR